jgi:hypothetical protein
MLAEPRLGQNWITEGPRDQAQRDSSDLGKQVSGFQGLHKIEPPASAEVGGSWLSVSKTRGASSRMCPSLALVRRSLEWKALQRILKGAVSWPRRNRFEASSGPWINMIEFLGSREPRINRASSKFTFEEWLFEVCRSFFAILQVPTLWVRSRLRYSTISCQSTCPTFSCHWRAKPGRPCRLLALDRRLPWLFCSCHRQ